MLLAPVGELLKGLGVAPEQWDALIVGDGSGTGWDRGCGWAAVLIDHYTASRALFKGSWDPGTVNVAELMAYFHALFAYASGPGKSRLFDLLRRSSGARVKVHIISDSEVVVRQGKGDFSRKSNAPIWAGIDCLVARGYQLHWHWLPRDKIGLNRLTDHLSRECRKAVEAIQPPDGTTVYNFNP